MSTPWLIKPAYHGSSQMCSSHCPSTFRWPRKHWHRHHRLRARSHWSVHSCCRAPSPKSFIFPPLRNFLLTTDYYYSNCSKANSRMIRCFPWFCRQRYPETIDYGRYIVLFHPEGHRAGLSLYFMQVSITPYLCPDVVLMKNARSTFDELKDKSQWPNNHNYAYSSTTSNSRLYLHLECFHYTEYLKIGQERGWVMQLASIKVQAIWAAKHLLKQQVPFTPDNVTNHLIHFITANDQVRSTLLKVDSMILLFSTVYKCGRKPAVLRLIDTIPRWLQWQWHASQVLNSARHYWGMAGMVCGVEEASKGQLIYWNLYYNISSLMCAPECPMHFVLHNQHMVEQMATVLSLYYSALGC